MIASGRYKNVRPRRQRPPDDFISRRSELQIGIKMPADRNIVAYFAVLVFAASMIVLSRTAPGASAATWKSCPGDYSYGGGYTYDPGDGTPSTVYHCCGQYATCVGAGENYLLDTFTGTSGWSTTFCSFADSTTCGASPTSGCTGAAECAGKTKDTSLSVCSYSNTNKIDRCSSTCALEDGACESSCSGYTGSAECDGKYTGDSCGTGSKTCDNSCVCSGGKTLSMHSSPSSVDADGSSSSTITASTSDSASGKYVSLSTTRGHLSSSSCTTGSSGSCSVTITSTSVGTATITGDSSGYSSATASVYFRSTETTCTPDGCNNVCPSGCGVSQDPDCACQNNNGCCPSGCAYSNDNDCPQQTCNLLTATVTADCAGGSSSACEAGETIAMSGTYTGDCSAATFFQIDANDGSGCVLEYSVPPAAISGVSDSSITLSSGSVTDASWTVPTIPSACKGKTVSASAAALWTGAPDTGTWIDGAGGVSGSFTFASGSTGGGSCPCEAFTLSMKPGWNLISLPYSYVDSVTSDTCGATDGNFYTYDAAAGKWDVQTVGIASLKKATSYWFRAGGYCSVTVQASGDVGANDIAFSRNEWNDLGAPKGGMNLAEIANAKCNNCVSGKCTSMNVLYYDTAAGQFKTAVGALEEGVGYRVQCLDVA